MTSDQRIREAMIVAGGRGTRLQPLTFEVPKPLLPFCGQPFLAGVVARLARAGVKRTWLVVGADTMPFEPLSVAIEGMDVSIVPEPTPLDTAGGVRSIADQLDGPVLVLNGDILTDTDLRRVADHHEAQQAAATIVLTRVDDTSSFGVCVLDGTRVIDFVEKPALGTLPGQDAVNAGTYVIDPAVLADFPAGPLSFERDVFPGILESGRTIESVVHDGVWIDLGTPERWLEGVRHALAGTLDWPSLRRFDLADDRVLTLEADIAGTASIVGPVGIERSKVAAQATIGPDTWIGPNVEVDVGARVRRSVVMEGSTVGAGLDLERAIVGRECRLEAGATIGPGVVIGHGQVIRADEVLAANTRRPPRRD